mgnify:CR=1 FL=1
MCGGRGGGEGAEGICLTEPLCLVALQGKWILRFDDTNPKTCHKENVEAYLKASRRHRGRLGKP